MPAVSRPIPSEGQTAAVPATRQGQQAQTQWRSSLDIVFSYSRSQAFYGQNLQTSPSFVAEARWRGPHGQGGDEETDEDSLYTEEDGDDEDDDEADETLQDEEHLEDGRRPRVSIANSDEDGIIAQPLDFGTVDSGRSGAPASSAAGATEETGLLSRSKRLSRSSLSQRRRSSAAVSSAHPPTSHTGTSTFGQTLFNCVNALVGVGILSLPLALSYAGLPLGIALFILAGLITNYTGKLLHKIMMYDPTLATYADIGRLAFGDRSRIAVTLLFCSELWAVSVALLVLFGDSVAALLPPSMGGSSSSSIPAWLLKSAGFLVVLPTCFMPMRLLSPVSLVGIFTTCSLLVIVFANGSLKHASPGSLWQPVPDALDVRPQWGKLPLAFGLIMSGFSSHPIIPSLVRDMQRPEMFPRMLDTAYAIATVLYLSMGVAGYLMFGRAVSDEITRDLAGVREYPRWTTHVAVGLIAAVSVSKFALALRPVQTTVEGLVCGGVGGAVEAAESAFEDVEGDASREGGEDAPASNGEQATAVPAPDVATPASLLGLRKQRSIDQFQQQQPQSTASSQQVNGLPPLPRDQRQQRPRPPTTQHRRLLIRFLLPTLVLCTALVLPGFATLMSFLGSVLAGLSCICGPLAAHLVVFGPGRRGAGKGNRRRISSSSGGGGCGGKRLSMASALSAGHDQPGGIEDEGEEEALMTTSSSSPPVSRRRSRRLSTGTTRSMLPLPVQTLGPLRRAAEMTLIVLAAIMAVLGTVWSSLPVARA